MDKKESFEIVGLGGKRTLTGKIEVKGAKNAVLKVLASSILFKDGFSLTNVPDTEDVARILELLADLGVTAERTAHDAYTIDTSKINNWVIKPEISKRLRSSVVLTGPLLARFGQVTFPYPGGCVIGKRPIDIFLEGFEKMGAEIVTENDSYKISVVGGKLKGTAIFLRVPSVTATETFIMAGVLAEGKTVLENCALEPEIESLGRFLIECGAKISGLGTPTITIEGGDLLAGAGKTYQTIPDRIETGSFMILAALCGKDIEIAGCEPNHVQSLIAMLSEAGVSLEVNENSIRVTNNKDSAEGKYRALDIKTHEYPGFPTDLQALAAVFLTQAEGESFIFETIFEGRLGYLETLNQMGANAKMLDAHRALVYGPTPLRAREVESPDLRAGMAYIIAALVAEGKSLVHNVYYIERGYEKIDDRLAKLGVSIRRIT